MPDVTLSQVELNITEPCFPEPKNQRRCFARCAARGEKRAAPPAAPPATSLRILAGKRRGLLEQFRRHIQWEPAAKTHSEVR